jgi:hypothetical protein
LSPWPLLLPILGFRDILYVVGFFRWNEHDDFKPSHTERFDQRLNALARQIVNIPGPGARFDWLKILPADRFEVAYEALLLAVEELGVEAENGELLYKARSLLPHAAREWRKLYQNAPLNKKEVRTELHQERIPVRSVAEERLERLEEIQAVREVLAELGPEDAALLAAMIEHKNPTEAARALGMPRQTFIDRLDKAKRRFAELYEG